MWTYTEFFNSNGNDFMYKVYDPNGNPVFFYSLKELRYYLDLTPEETKRCFYHGVHTLENGMQVITYNSKRNAKTIRRSDY
jgi:hypothetical protein